jgi:hypothetical protein
VTAQRLAGRARPSVSAGAWRAQGVVVGPRRVKKGSGPNSWKPAQIGSLLLFLLFSFLSLFKLKLYSNLIQTLVTNYSQMILRHKQYYFEDILLYILFLYLFSFWFQF